MIQAQAPQGDLSSSAGERMPACHERHDALIRARCALGIVHAHYWRALRIAETTRDAPSRASAYAEARRLARVAVALAARTRALQVPDASDRGSPRRGLTGRHARRRPAYGPLPAA